MSVITNAYALGRSHSIVVSTYSLDGKLTMPDEIELKKIQASVVCKIINEESLEGQTMHFHRGQD